MVLREDEVTRERIIMAVVEYVRAAYFCVCVCSVLKPHVRVLKWIFSRIFGGKDSSILRTNSIVSILPPLHLSPLSSTKMKDEMWTPRSIVPLPPVPHYLPH